MAAVEIIPYTPEYKIYFELINKEWLEKYFSVEQFDLDQLVYPKESIIDNGGAIIFAKDGEDIIGTVALINTPDDGVFELVKLGVLSKAQGKKVGHLLVEGILLKAKEMGGTKVILYSNSKLRAALSLYRKFGFAEVTKECSKYSRCDLKMEIKL